MTLENFLIIVGWWAVAIGAFSICSLVRSIGRVEPNSVEVQLAIMFGWAPIGLIGLFIEALIG